MYALSIGLSAFLLFLVQPLIARIILPWFGGSAAVWATCLMFFQLVLLGGYGYAHASIRYLRPRSQRLVHVSLLAASILVLPILPGPGWKPPDGLHPGLRIVALLGATVGVPYLLLSTTGPLLQAWYARAKANRSPYRLYALSNACSLAALLGYPLVIEPLTRLRVQAYWWSAAYIVFAIMCARVALSSREQGAIEESIREPESSPPGAGLYLLWMGLAFCPSLLLVAVTSHMTQNIAPVPLLWVAPLALYLSSFILTFESERWYGRRFWFPLFIFAAALMLAFLFPHSIDPGPKWVIPLFTLGFFICAVVCHGELYRLRPPAPRLTSFYLMVAAGGALGGIAVAVVAPAVFNSYLELPLGLLITVLMVGIVLDRAAPALPGPAARYIEYALVGALAAGFVYLLAWEQPRYARGFTLIKRNFYGVLRVNDVAETGETEPIRELHNGTIIHGSEYLREPFHRRPTTYYGPDSGIGISLADEARAARRRVGVIGLGAGTLSAYARPGDFYRFYDINPLVVDIAKSYFFYLKECPARWDIVLGDARLSLEREAAGRFDVLAVDAFSGDSIPVHLLSVEAFREYFRVVKPDGLVAVHTSNKYLALGGVVSRAAAVLGKSAVLISSLDDDFAGTYKADWFVLANDARVFMRPEWNRPSRVALPAGSELWTDDYSNLFKILK